MSAETWREKYYPLDAAKLKNLHDVALVKHALQKWEGLREDNLKEHGLDGPPIHTTTATCALCQTYYPYSEDEDEDELPCSTCPLFMQLGRRCDDGGAPYDLYDPKVPGSEKAMIDALKETLNTLEVQGRQ